MGKGDLAKECNVVHVDQRWKDYVKKEDFVKKAWYYKWGFLAQQYQEVCHLIINQSLEFNIPTVIAS